MVPPPFLLLKWLDLSLLLAGFCALIALLIVIFLYVIVVSVLMTDSRLHFSLLFREKIRLVGLVTLFIVSHPRWVEIFCQACLPSARGPLFALGAGSLTDQLWLQMWGPVRETRAGSVLKKVWKLEKVHVTGILKNQREHCKWQAPCLTWLVKCVASQSPVL